MAKAEPRKIAMKDGRTVDFGEKQRMDKSYATNAAGNVVVSIDFDNGETVQVEVAPGSKVGLTGLGHGLSQKLGDAAAGADSTNDAFESVLEVAARIAAGEWDKGREAGTGGTAKGASELVEALTVVLGQSKETVRGMLAKLSQGDKMALRRTPKVAEAIERIKAERKPTKATEEKAAAGAALLDALTRGETPVSHITDADESEEAPL